MPVPAYMSIEGETQGPITAGTFTDDSVGNIWQAGHEDEILVQAVSHNVTTPIDPQSGQPTGQRVHKPFIFTKIFDKSSPLIYTALCKGEKLTKCEIKWFRIKGSIEEHYFTMQFEDAIVVDIKTYMPNCQDPASASFTHLEDISISYRKITWTHEVAGTSGEDDWQDRL